VGLLLRRLVVWFDAVLGSLGISLMVRRSSLTPTSLLRKVRILPFLIIILTQFDVSSQPSGSNKAGSS